MNPVSTNVKPGSDNTGEIPVDFYSAANESKTTLVFVGGSGDVKDNWNEIIEHLQEKTKDYNFATFTFSERLSDKKYTLKQQTHDLDAVIKHLICKTDTEEIIIMATSMGFSSTSMVLAGSVHTPYIKRVLLIDPADYLLSDHQELAEKDGTWGGADDFDKSANLYSNLAAAWRRDIRVDVVHFTLKNYGPDGYLDQEYKDRGKDHEDGFARLNTQMIESIYEKLPDSIKGQYLTLDGVPHGIGRDGDIDSNRKKVADLLFDLITAQ